LTFGKFALKNLIFAKKMNDKRCLFLDFLLSGQLSDPLRSAQKCPFQGCMKHCISSIDSIFCLKSPEISSISAGFDILYRGEVSLASLEAPKTPRKM
jgi:hypothetical protein